MKIKEVIVIQRTPAEVWPWIAIPERFLQWNGNIVSMGARERFVLHQPFNSHYQLRGKPLQCLSTVTALEEGRLLELRHGNCIGKDMAGDMEVTERITLEDGGDHTKVVRTIKVKNHRIPLIALPLIWFVNHFGRPTEPSRLKYLCEGREIPAAKEMNPIEVFKHGQEEASAEPGDYSTSRNRAYSFSLAGMLVPLAVIASFGWMLANAVDPVSAAIVRVNAQGYREAVFIVEKLHHEQSGRTGLRWGFSGTIEGAQERFYAPELDRDLSAHYLVLKRRFPPGTKLDVLYNPEVTGVLFQGRTIRVLPHVPDFVAAEERRINWWLQFCLAPFVVIMIITSRIQKKSEPTPADDRTL